MGIGTERVRVSSGIDAGLSVHDVGTFLLVLRHRQLAVPRMPSVTSRRSELNTRNDGTDDSHPFSYQTADGEKGLGHPLLILCRQKFPRRGDDPLAHHVEIAVDQRPGSFRVTAARELLPRL